MNGGELEQIQFLLGHVSVLTTERYLGCKQNLEEPVNDRFGCLPNIRGITQVYLCMSAAWRPLLCTKGTKGHPAAISF